MWLYSKHCFRIICHLNNFICNFLSISQHTLFYNSSVVLFVTILSLNRMNSIKYIEPIKKHTNQGCHLRDPEFTLAALCFKSVIGLQKILNFFFFLMIRPTIALTGNIVLLKHTRGHIIKF